ncbi:ATP phosphoribosyltransferase 1, chloroplastic [Vitis vinifera]|uniref:ATP phosphoribosyltransferase 1, chloroplastic n=1 Tax=Vitis vinifera TaxID=29760 RepID=A0A438GFE9_VITVI|nr:ATP phosphoribosyltransferase 1, chloroplastic [Vitis vinifera]
MSMFLQQCPSLFTFPSSSPSFSAQISVKSTVFCCLSPSPVTVVNGNTERRSSERNEIRLGLPSKGRMATDTLDLLKVVSFPLALFGCRKVMENLGIGSMRTGGDRRSVIEKGLSTFSQAGESSTICCRNSTGPSIPTTAHAVQVRIKLLRFSAFSSGSILECLNLYCYKNIPSYLSLSFGGVFSNFLKGAGLMLEIPSVPLWGGFGSSIHVFVAFFNQLSNMEVWFQRPKDIVRKLLSGDLDLGIVGLDTVTEYGQVSIKV